jgi:3-oxoacyl-ACP reductase-like protein
MQWSTGTRTQGASQGAAGGISGGAVSGGAVAGAVAGAGGGAASLEAKCAQLQHDVDSLALFARTLLTMLEESKLVTRAQFDETKNRLDMLDGKLDDR